MLGLAQADRWSCPTCHRTEVMLRGRPDAVHRAIVRAQMQHAHDHAVERLMLKIEAAA